MMISHLFLAAAATISSGAQPTGQVTAPAYSGTPRQVLNELARCIASRRPNDARAALALPAGSPEQLAAANVLMNGTDGCGAGGAFEIDMHAMGLVGGLAEGLLDAQRTPRQLASLSSWNSEAIGRSALRPRNANEDFSLCVVRSAPQEAQRVVAARPDTPDERAAMTALVPHLSQCAPQGATLRFDRATVRGQVAVGLHRAASFLATAPAQASIGTRN